MVFTVLGSVGIFVRGGVCVDDDNFRVGIFTDGQGAGFLPVDGDGGVFDFCTIYVGRSGFVEDHFISGVGFGSLYDGSVCAADGVVVGGVNVAAVVVCA